MNYTVQTSIINHTITNKWYVENEIHFKWDKGLNTVSFSRKDIKIFELNILQLSQVPDSTKEAFGDEEIADGIIECLKKRV